MDGRVLVPLLLISLTVLAGPAASGHPAVHTAPFREVGTQTCSCGEAQPGTAAPAAYRLAPSLAPAPIYDEQLGISFTQDFTSLAYNVTAVEQQDPTTGDGPAYLLNGLTGLGFWYQVGLSWNWNPGANPGSGFDMNYEVYSSSGNSIFPATGGGGLLNLSGPVNEGDSVLLNLYFSSGMVVMLVHDWNTGAMAEETYDAGSATSFVGTPLGLGDRNGYFTGLMTEWYHSSPYLSNEQEVTFTDKTLAISSAWLWIDEYDPNPPVHSVFSNQTSSPVSFTSDPAQLQEFASNGATEYASAYQFVTGALNATQPTTVSLTLSYSVMGGGTSYAAPVLTYTSGGKQVTATLGTSPTTYTVDAGTTWSVSNPLPGSSSNERWATAQDASATASASGTVALVYYHQYAASISYSEVNGGGGVPVLQYTSFGQSGSTAVGTAPSVLWVDAGSFYAMPNPLLTIHHNLRWESASGTNGTVNSAVTISPTYYEQLFVTANYSIVGGGSPPAPSVNYTLFGTAHSLSLSTSAQSFWADAISNFTLPVVIGNSTQERWVLNSTSALLTPLVVLSPSYQNQYYVSVQPSPPTGGSITTSPPQGWYDAGSALGASVTASPGWQFEYWVGSNGSRTSSLPSTVTGPLNETAVLYPSLAITAGSDNSVAYTYTDSQGATVQGTVASGSSSTIYVPPSGVTLTAKPSSLLYSFKGWSGASSSSSPSIALSVKSPETITGASAFSYLDAGAVAAAAIILIALFAVLLSRRTKAAGSPAA